MYFGCYVWIILGSSSLFQSIYVSGFTIALSSNIVLYARFCHFLKQSIQLFEVQKLKIPRWVATCRAFSFRCCPSMDVFVVWACLNLAERMVLSSSSSKVFRDFRKWWPTMRVTFLHFRLFTIMFSVDTDKPSIAAISTRVPTSVSTSANIGIFFVYTKHIALFLHCLLIWGHFHNKMENLWLHSWQSLDTYQFHTCFPYNSSHNNGIAWLVLLPLLVLLDEFILAIEAAHILLANFAGLNITLVS